MKIFDLLRRKYVTNTPEEEVRQKTIETLISHIGVPQTLMASEYSFKFNGLQYRSDIVVFDRQLKPIMMVECKAPDVKIEQAVIDQVIRYNFVLKVRYIMITNGKTTYLCKWNPSKEKYEFINAVPSYAELTESNGNPQ